MSNMDIQKAYLEERSPRGTATLNWWAKTSNKYDPQPNCSVTPLINGERAFAAVENAIKGAKQSIDIISWGFDPAMQLTRPGGDKLGELLAEKGKDGAQVRVLIWKNVLANVMENTVIGDGLMGSGGTMLGSGLASKSSPYSGYQKLLDERAALIEDRDKIKSIHGQAGGKREENLDRILGDELERIESRLAYIESQLNSDNDYGGKIRGSGGTFSDADAEIYTRDWFNKVHGGGFPGVEFKTRDFDKNLEELRWFHWGNGAVGVINGLLMGHREELMRRLFRDQDQTLNWKMIGALGFFPSHHQKMVLVDYNDPKKARGFVMGHNLHRNYWDTDAHNFSESRRDLGFGPWQDISTEVSGPILCDLNENFCTAWDRESSFWTRWFGTTLTDTREHLSYKDFYNTQRRGMAQIIRTHPYDGKAGKGPETSILESYNNAVNNANDFIYTENQYFRYPQLAAGVKAQAEKLAGKGAERELYWFVITNNINSSSFSSSTYEMMQEIGQEQLMPQVHRDRVFLLQEKRDFLQSGRARMQHRKRLQQEIKELEKEIRLDEDDQARLIQSEKDIQRMEALDEMEHEGKGMTKAEQQELKQLRDAHGYDKIDPDIADQEGLKTVIGTLVSYQQTEDGCQYKDIYVHSKLLVVDDVYFLLSSANINKRSLETDTELGIHAPRPEIARQCTDHLWRLHAGKRESKTMLNFNHWNETAVNNWINRKHKKALSCSLTRFWDTQTPYSKALD